MQRVQVRFQGRVQGVGFRATARGVARRFAVSGWVRNEPDGMVLLEAQGASDIVAAYLEALRQNMGQNITREDATSVPPIEGEAGFQVRS